MKIDEMMRAHHHDHDRRPGRRRRAGRAGHRAVGGPARRAGAGRGAAPEHLGAPAGHRADHPDDGDPARLGARRRRARPQRRLHARGRRSPRRWPRRRWPWCPAATRRRGRPWRSAPRCPRCAPRTTSNRCWSTRCARRAARSGSAATLTGLRVTPDGVRAQLGRTGRVRARFVVGADGPRSRVRRALGIGVQRLGVLGEFVQAIFRAGDLAALTGQPVRPLTMIVHPEAEGVLLPVGAGRLGFRPRVVPGAGRDPGLLAGRWTALLRAATGLPELEPEILSVLPFTMAADVATSYRAGNGFLAGDAAHRMTPVGAVGLNTALHDGHELGWRLAWAARGLAGERAAGRATPSSGSRSGGPTRSGRCGAASPTRPTACPATWAGPTARRSWSAPKPSRAEDRPGRPARRARPARLDPPRGTAVLGPGPVRRTADACWPVAGAWRWESAADRLHPLPLQVLPADPSRVCAGRTGSPRGPRCWSAPTGWSPGATTARAPTPPPLWAPR